MQGEKRDNHKGLYDWPLEGLDAVAIRAAMEKSRADVQALSEPAFKAFHARRYSEAVAWAQLAADFAWNSHTGRYAWPELENMLLEVAGHVGGVRPGKKISLPPTGGGKKRVLHILTIAYQTGGHTRCVERWIRNTRDDYTHAVLNTGLSEFTPSWLGDAAESSGGWLLQMDRPFTDILRKAGILRDITHSWADVVVLHTHPNDLLPVLAFGIEEGPPVILFNHADHVFWLGGSVADIVVDFRPAGQDLSLRRRGVKLSAVLPVPLLPVQPTMGREEARRQLGLDDDTTLLLTIASAYKLAPYGGYDFLSLVGKVLDENPKALLLAVGPEDAGSWAEQRELTNGRIRALGERRNISEYYAAADIYLDSFPYGSMTSMLDAGLYGVPSIGLLNPLSRANLAGDVSQERCATHCMTREEYEEALTRLIRDPSHRRRRGRELAETVREDHLMPGWKNYLDRVMDKTPKKHRPSPLPELSRETDMDDFFLTCIQQAGTMSNHVFFFFGHHIKYLPAGARYSLAWDNYLRRGLFKNKKLRMKHFRSYRIPSGKQIKKWLRGIWKRSRQCHSKL